MLCCIQVQQFLQQFSADSGPNNEQKSNSVGGIHEGVTESDELVLREFCHVLLGCEINAQSCRCIMNIAAQFLVRVCDRMLDVLAWFCPSFVQSMTEKCA